MQIESSVYPACPPNPLSAQGAGGLLLFEFFVTDRSLGVSVSRVRFHERSATAKPLAGLHSILGVGSTGQAYSKLLSPIESLHRPDVDKPLFGSRLAGSVEDTSDTIELRSPTAHDGVCSGEVVGLVFQLGSGETIDTLIDNRLAHGDVQPEVEVSIDGGERFWAGLTRRVNASFVAPGPAKSMLAAKPCPAALVAPHSQVAVHTWTWLQTDQSNQPSAHDRARKVLTLVLCGGRAREPPKSTDTF